MFHTAHYTFLNGIVFTLLSFHDFSVTQERWDNSTNALTILTPVVDTRDFSISTEQPSQTNSPTYQDVREKFNNPEVNEIPFPDGRKRNISIEFFICSWTKLSTQFSNSEYETYGNGSVYVNTNGQMYGPLDYAIMKGTLFVCEHQGTVTITIDDMATGKLVTRNVSRTFETCDKKGFNPGAYIIYKDGSAEDLISGTVNFPLYYIIWRNMLVTCDPDVPDDGTTTLAVHDINLYDPVSDTLITKYVNSNFRDCIKLGLSPEDYEVYQNGTAYVPTADVMYDPLNHIVWQDILLVCATNDSLTAPQEIRDVILYDSVKRRFVTNFVSKSFFECGKWRLGGDHYQVYKNGSVYVMTYNKSFDLLNSIVWKDKLLVCNDSFTQDVTDKSSGIDIVENMTATYRKRGSEINITFYVSNAFKFCEKFVLNQPEYMLFENGTTYVPLYKKWYDSLNHVIIWKRTLLVCIPQEANYIFIYLTNVCLSISIVCLLLHLISFACNTTTRNLAGCNLASLSFALLIAYSFFLATQITDIDEVPCLALSAILYYSFLVAFLWMNVIAFDNFRTLKLATTKLKTISAKLPVKRFFIYSLYSWGLPIVGVALAVYSDIYKTLVPDSYLPKFANDLCWFNNPQGLLVFFAIPIFCILGGNIIFFSLSTHIICTRYKIKICSMDQHSLRRDFLLYLKLAVIMGLTWVLGAIAGIVKVKSLWYIFIVLNGLQGFFIFVAFSCRSQMVRLFKTLKLKRRSLMQSTNSSNVLSNGTN